MKKFTEKYQKVPKSVKIAKKTIFYEHLIKVFENYYNNKLMIFLVFELIPKINLNKGLINYWIVKSVILH